ncbi:titin [Caerostris extrusa]|uniref:Titin n=1 Tax=Caerostris extrusa TaxID=172846 RepID=A0AAV4QNQ9_CAEEX|nr:titin [Caerostris extrusa]
MRVEWMKDGRPVEASSRISTFFNFGYVSLFTIRGVDTRDTGTYICVATNSMGTASTTSRLICISKKSILVETQHPEGLEKFSTLKITLATKEMREKISLARKNPLSLLSSLARANSLKDRVLILKQDWNLWEIPP